MTNNHVNKIDETGSETWLALLVFYGIVSPLLGVGIVLLTFSLEFIGGLKYPGMYHSAGFWLFALGVGCMFVAAIVYVRDVWLRGDGV